ncbi:hypothetical protein NA57DRAFT_71515 [Rhizodiscina lignyota]|uniref:Ubiquitin 3 binding protein But2 C-terminal domain-containing protein n=1 Tax=Rhizodiscina lignyota TaxID=1504668 RepID=A0A9P4INL2_9PEZI|nr:hypothetical protein NA57DRAFT_71515 [Rhizodiscina lignyota]
MKFFLAAAALLGLVAPSPVSEPGYHKGHVTCPVNGTLPPSYVKPCLMVPVSAKRPTVAFGGTEKPIITPNDFCTIFNLDLPPSAYDKVCQLVFLFPDHHQTPSWYSYHGAGHFSFTGYAVGAGATEQTTYKNQPVAGPNPPSPPAELAPGNAYVINSAPCGLPKGLTAPVTVSGMLCSTDTTLKFLQSDAKCPLGFFVELLDQ